MQESIDKNEWPTASGHDRTEPDTSGYTLTIEEAAEIFASAGVPRNPRSIRRFCQKGELDCMTIETATSSRYLVRRSSVEKLITEKQQALQFSESRTRPAMTGQDRPRPDIAGHDRTPDPQPPSADETETRELAATIKRLEAENLNLRIDNRGKEAAINQLAQQARDLIGAVQDTSWKLGAAEQRLVQLEAPRPGGDEEEQRRGGEPATSEPVHAPIDAEIEQTAEPEPTPAPRRSVFGRLFG